MKLTRRFLLSVLTFCAGGLISLPAQAPWGSIRANNRTQPHEVRPAPSRAVVAPERGREAVRGDERERREHREVYSRTGREPERERHFGTFNRERHLDFDEDRRHAYFWSGITAGSYYSALPSGYVPVYVGANPYYYYQGAYYQPENSGFVAVIPPVGAIVPNLPPGADPVSVGQYVYYYANGAFYLQQPQGFAVVAPPLGVTVGGLPPGATPVYVRGGLYYQSGGVYYMPSMQGGITVYTTVQP